MSGDKGEPVVVRMPNSAVSQAFGCIAEKVANVLGVRKTAGDMQIPRREDETATSEEEHLDEGRGLEGGSS
jgi:MinD-like ATPase involved in chromosome partitioning or flagellar assembly